MTGKAEFCLMDNIGANHLSKYRVNLKNDLIGY